MNKRYGISANPTQYIRLGALMIVLSNPLLYLLLGSLIIYIKNLFGASVDRQSISFNTNDHFIQAMGIVTLAGLILVVVGQYSRRNSSKRLH